MGVFDRIVPLKYRHFIAVKEMPEFPKEQQGRFNYAVARIDDYKGGVFGASDSVHRLWKGKPLSLFALERITLANEASITAYEDKEHWLWGVTNAIPVDDNEFDRCQLLQPCLERARDKAHRLVSETKVHNSLFMEQDLAGQQTRVAWIMAFTSICSTIAAIASAYAAFTR